MMITIRLYSSFFALFFRLYLDSKTGSIIAIFILHFELDYTVGLIQLPEVSI